MQLLRYLCPMQRYRQIVAYRNYFDDFFQNQNEKVRNKIIKVLDIVETIERVPESYLKHIQEGLFEIRVQLGSDIFRVFCFFDRGKLVILLTGFQKKTQKTPKKEINKALQIMNEYYKEMEEKI